MTETLCVPAMKSTWLKNIAVSKRYVPSGKACDKTDVLLILLRFYPNTVCTY